MYHVYILSIPNPVNVTNAEMYSRTCLGRRQRRRKLPIPCWSSLMPRVNRACAGSLATTAQTAVVLLADVVSCLVVGKTREALPNQIIFGNPGRSTPSGRLFVEYAQAGRWVPLLGTLDIGAVAR